MKLHFVGICGSGAAQVAILAKKMGHDVDGCDININYNCKMLIKEGIKVYSKHSEEHIENTDWVIVSPLLLRQKIRNSEVNKSILEKKCMTWEEFLSKYIVNNHDLIIVSGTHGKTTIALLLHNMLIKSMKNVVTIAGENSYFDFKLESKNKIFVVEAEEYNANFMVYNPSISIINNIEMDHPGQFHDINASIELYIQFCNQMKKEGILVVNIDDKNVCEVIAKVSQNRSDIYIIGYTKELRYRNTLCDEIYYFEYDNKDEIISIIKPDGKKERFSNLLNGLHNAYNLVSVYIISNIEKIGNQQFEQFVKSDNKIPRRMELVKKYDKRIIFNDYAHHPTEMNSVLKTLKAKYEKEICVVWQPNQYDRTLYFFDEYVDVLTMANSVIILNIDGKGDDNWTHFPYDDFVNVLLNKGIKTVILDDISYIKSEITKISNEDSVCILFSTDFKNELIKKISF